MGAFSPLGFQDAGLAYSIPYLVALRTLNHNNLTAWQCSQIFPNKLVEYTAYENLCRVQALHIST